MKPNSNETELTGKWLTAGGQVHADAICERIQWLTSHHLRKIAISKQCGEWETLFQDPDDGRYWEKIYPKSEMHGGGPLALKSITKEQAKTKYGDEIKD